MCRLFLILGLNSHFLNLRRCNSESKNSYSFDAKNDAKNETQKTLEEEIIDLIKNNNSISKIEMAMKTESQY